jgi:hypothetical protein
MEEINKFLDKEIVWYYMVLIILQIEKSI